ncbi:MAG: co-chaperone YbbN, partial [Actinobacteria bacterium]
QVSPIIDELLSAAAQMGVTGGVKLSHTDTVEPEPVEHRVAREAEASGDIPAAIAAWENVLSHHSRDEKAKSELARLRLVQRTSSENTGDPQSQADALFGEGNHAQAFNILLDIIETSSNTEEKDTARTRLLDLFRIAGNTGEVRAARTRLATLLMV